MTNDEVMRKALHRAFSLGQTYWHQADSESYAANKRADVTQATFNTLVEETIAHLSARPEPQAAVSDAEIMEAVREEGHFYAEGCNLIDQEQMLRIARAVLAASRQVPVGWKLVPVEPTPEMLAAWPCHNHGAGHEAAIYRAMLAASPLPAGEPRQEEGERVVDQKGVFVSRNANGVEGRTK